MLHLDSMTLTQGDFRLTVRGHIPPGITAIVGPSGGGKSTLLAAIAGFIQPTAGRILWQGIDITSHSPGKRPVAMLFQDNNLFPHLTVAQNVGLALAPKLRLSADQNARVAAILESVGLADMGLRKPAALSGGQQSRAALARTLLADRDIVLLDEAFAALGPALRTEMLMLISRNFVGRTVLMVTHDPADARLISDQVVLVSDGMTHAPTPTAEIFANPPDALRAYLGA